MANTQFSLLLAAPVDIIFEVRSTCTSSLLILLTYRSFTDLRASFDYRTLAADEDEQDDLSLLAR